MSSKRRIAIACEVLMFIIGAWWIVTRIATKSEHSLATYTYSQFLNQVNGGQVASVVVVGNNSGALKATYQLKDGKTLRTVLPSDYRDAMAAMQHKLVDVEIKDSSSTTLINAIPVFLLFALWLYFMIRKFPNSREKTILGTL